MLGQYSLEDSRTNGYHLSKAIEKGQSIASHLSVAEQLPRKEGSISLSLIVFLLIALSFTGVSDDIFEQPKGPSGKVKLAAKKGSSSSKSDTGKEVSDSRVDVHKF